MEGGTGTLTGRVTDGQLSLMMLDKTQLFYEFDVPPSLTYKREDRATCNRDQEVGFSPTGI